MRQWFLWWLLLPPLLAGCGAGDVESGGGDADPGYDRVVLCELFVGLACARCPEAEAALDQLTEEEPAGDLAAIHWHSGTVYPDEDAIEFARTRMNGYTNRFGGPGGVPTCFVDGLRRITGAETEEVAYEAYKDAYTRERGVKSPVRIEVTPEVNSQTVRATIKMTSRSDVALSGVDLVTVLLEHGALNSNPRFGPERWSYLARAADKQIVSINGAGTASYEATLSLEETWDRSRLLIVAFIQSPDYDEVLQAAMIPVP